MHAKLFDYYEQELKHIRESAAEFAKEHGKVARRLALSDAASGGECPDPYVERLLEGFAFLSARIHIRQDAEYAKFTQHLLEMVFPGYLSPVPSMMIVQLTPDLNDPGLAAGPKVARMSTMQSRLAPGERTPCTFRTGHEVRLWPLELVKARYQGHVTDLSAQTLEVAPRARACLRLRFKVTAALTADKLALDTLTLYLAGSDNVAYRVYEQLFAQCIAVAVHQPNKRSAHWIGNLPADALEPGGLRDDEALLPAVAQSFTGYRLLREYSAMPERYLFAHLNGLNQILAKIDSDEFELLFVMDRVDTVLEKTVAAGNFMLHCVPAINLFPKQADLIEVKPGQHEHPLVADKGQKMNFEIFAIEQVAGIDDSGVRRNRQFNPIYNQFDQTNESDQAYYALRRVPHYLTKEQTARARTGYVGTEVYLSLVDRQESPLSGQVTHLSVNTLCSNRDLPITLDPRAPDLFSFEESLPVQSIRCVRLPTRPMAPAVEAETPWRMLSHLQLNYLSLVDGAERKGAEGLRELLSLYGMDPLSPLHKQVDGLVSVSAQASICRVPVPGPIAFGRGVAVALTCDEQAFEGSNIMVLGTVLERFLARHASLNSFVQLVLLSQTRGEVKRWKPRIGLRSIT